MGRDVGSALESPLSILVFFIIDLLMALTLTSVVTFDIIST